MTTNPELAPDMPELLPCLFDRGKLHDAFWEAFKTLDPNISKRFSMHTGRKFADAICDAMEGK